MTPSVSSILSHHKSQFMARSCLCSGSQKHFVISDSDCRQSVIVQIEASLKEQEVWENTVEMGVIQ